MAALILDAGGAVAIDWSSENSIFSPLFLAGSKLAKTDRTYD